MMVLDWLIIALYGIGVLWLGLITSKKTNNETDYFLAGRGEHWGPVAASTWATKLSALTFIGVPGAAMSGNFAYLQLWFGSFLAAYLISILFIPEFYRLRVATVYEYLGQRIGPHARLGGTLVFIISRCLASAVRLAGCAIAVSVFFDLSLLVAIMLIATVAAVYVLAGGLRAVIWTDTVQLALFLVGAVISIAFVASALPGGIAQIISIGDVHDKFKVFDFRFDVSSATTFWTGNLFAFVLGIATGAADQDIAQRALACPNARQARIAVLTAGACDLISTFLFLSVGAAVFAYYQAFPQIPIDALIAEGRYDYIFPHFIRHELPTGFRGVLIVALLAAAMSSLDSALSGLASSAHFDLGMGRFWSKVNVVIGARCLVVVFAIVLALIALAFGTEPSILWFGLKIMGYTYGGLLGLFLLASLMPNFVDDRISLVATLTSIPFVLMVTHEAIPGLIGLAPAPWPWAVVIGVAWTIITTLLFSRKRHITSL